MLLSIAAPHLVFILEDSSFSKCWIRKDNDVGERFFNSFLLSSLLAQNSWKDIQFPLEVYLQSKVIINPFMAEKLNDELSVFEFEGRWR